MSTTKILIFSLKRKILPIIFILFTISLLLFSKSTLPAAKSGLLLWANSVVPALLPFFIATELLSYTNLISFLGKLLKNIMRPIFNVPGEGAHALIMGTISGYPIGAKIVTKFREDGTCTKEECERLLAFTNNSGPLFILGTVGITLFGNTTTGFLLLLTHILSSITVGIIFRFWKRNYNSKPNKLIKNSSKPPKQIATFSNLGEILAKSITSATSTIIMIGGFIVIFCVIISILKQSHILEICGNILSPIFTTFGIKETFSEPFITGLLELTNGVKQISSIACRSISTNIVLCSFLLGFGGISVLLQVFSIISKTDISIKPYFLGKLLQGSLAALYTYLLLHNIPFLNLDLAPVFSPSSKPILTHNYIYLLLLINIIISAIIFFSQKIKKQK